MKKFKPLLSPGVSKRLAEAGKQFAIGLRLGIMKGCADIAKSKLEPYKPPCGSWGQRYAPFNENTIKDIKRWYDIDY